MTLPEDSIIADFLTTFEQLVTKGDYDSALAQWKNAQGKVDDFIYWHNLGSLHLQMGQYPEARYALEKAQQKTIYSSATQQKLELIEERLSSGQLNESWSDYLNGALSYLGPMKLWILVLLVLSLVIWPLRLRASKRFLTTMLALLMIPVGFALWFQFSHLAARRLLQ